MATQRLAYRVPEAADALGVSRAKAYELISRGEIPSIRVGSSIRVPVDALRAWMDRQLAEQQIAEAR
jgi:excisionase family DNA binding protein